MDGWSADVVRIGPASVVFQAHLLSLPSSASVRPTKLGAQGQRNTACSASCMVCSKQARPSSPRNPDQYRQRALPLTGLCQEGIPAMPSKPYRSKALRMESLVFFPHKPGPLWFFSSLWDRTQSSPVLTYPRRQVSMLTGGFLRALRTIERQCPPGLFSAERTGEKIARRHLRRGLPRGVDATAPLSLASQHHVSRSVCTALESSGGWVVLSEESLL